MKKRGPKPKRKKGIKWNPSIAYIVGLISSDGSLSKDGRHIYFTSKDLQLAKLFKRSLNLKVKIGKKSRGSEKEKKYYLVQFGDVIFYHWLMDIRLTSNKSKTIGKLKIPDKYFFDFLRGCYDGDGSIYSYWDPRWQSSFMFYLQITSSSSNFLIWLQETIQRLSGAEGKIGRSNKAYCLRFAKENTRKIFKKMFYKKGLPCLIRKLNKANKIFIEDKRHTKT